MQQLVGVLVVGALADTVRCNPLFACLAVFNLIGAAILFALLRERGGVEG